MPKLGQGVSEMGKAQSPTPDAHDLTRWCREECPADAQSSPLWLRVHRVVFCSGLRARVLGRSRSPVGLHPE